jgi:hypothetical protein
MSAPGDEGKRRAEASASCRGWARPAQRHAEGVLTHSLRLQKPFTPRRAERPPPAEAPVEGHSHLTASGPGRTPRAKHWLLFLDESLSNMISCVWTLTGANEALAD